MIYFIQAVDGGPIKIGQSDNPRARLRGLAAEYQKVMRLLAVRKGGLAQEQAIHEQFAAFRLKGEWFSPHTVLLQYIVGVVGLLSSTPTAVPDAVDHDGFRPKQKAKEIPEDRFAADDDGSSFLLLNLPKHDIFLISSLAAANLCTPSEMIRSLLDDSLRVHHESIESAWQANSQLERVAKREAKRLKHEPPPDR